mmetsp:Transcript_8224/g.21232  ORF Transcript_8224/g.21232 Transcript_8224/m.21232 type:complete len:202 (+) Transcript_8224:2275-2880(+)
MNASASSRRANIVLRNSPTVRASAASLRCLTSSSRSSSILMYSSRGVLFTLASRIARQSFARTAFMESVAKYSKTSQSVKRSTRSWKRLAATKWCGSSRSIRSLYTTGSPATRTSTGSWVGSRRSPGRCLIFPLRRCTCKGRWRLALAPEKSSARPSCTLITASLSDMYRFSACSLNCLCAHWYTMFIPLPTVSERYDSRS